MTNTRRTLRVLSFDYGLLDTSGHLVPWFRQLFRESSQDTKLLYLNVYHYQLARYTRCPASPDPRMITICQGYPEANGGDDAGIVAILQHVRRIRDG
jgi:hypothetical protein